MLTIYRGPSNLPGNAPIVAVLATTSNGKLSSGANAVALTVYPDGEGGPLAALRAKRTGRTPHGACPADCPVACYAEMTAIERVAMGDPGRLRAHIQGRALPVTSPEHAVDWTAAVTRGARRPLLRLSAYGDTAALPSHIVSTLVAAAQRAGLRITAYTRGWRTSPHLRTTHMASVATTAERDEAIALGWRTYRTRAWSRSATTGAWEPEPLAPGEIACPATLEGGRRTTCDRCGLCDGQGKAPNRATIAAIDHGPGRAHRLQAWVGGGGR